jgi:hypothetical protein
LRAVNLGDDADTTGAAYGQLAGAHYGADSIPAAWRERLALRGLIEGFAERLWQLAAARSPGLDERRAATGTVSRNSGQASGVAKSPGARVAQQWLTGPWIASASLACDGRPKTRRILPVFNHNCKISNNRCNVDPCGVASQLTGSRIHGPAS